jgi:hypothetical protein
MGACTDLQPAVVAGEVCERVHQHQRARPREERRDEQHGRGARKLVDARLGRLGLRARARRDARDVTKFEGARDDKAEAGARRVQHVRAPAAALGEGAGEAAGEVVEGVQHQRGQRQPARQLGRELRADQRARRRVVVVGVELGARERVERPARGLPDEPGEEEDEE